MVIIPRNQFIHLSTRAVVMTGNASLKDSLPNKFQIVKDFLFGWTTAQFQQ